MEANEKRRLDIVKARDASIEAKKGPCDNFTQKFSVIFSGWNNMVIDQEGMLKKLKTWENLWKITKKKNNFNERGSDLTL